MKRTALLAAISFCNLAHAADAPVYGEPDCKIGAVAPQPKRDLVKWSGACKDDYAGGQGTLEWSAPGWGDLKFEGTLVRGELTEGTVTVERGAYTGTFQHGAPNGQGSSKYADGAVYEGAVKDYAREGTGVLIESDRSRFEGQWKHNKLNGCGKATYALGGSYEGEWKDGKFDGKGTIVYAGSGRRFEGLFKEGRVAGSASAVLVAPGNYGVSSEHSNHLNVPDSSASVPVPPDATWEQLTPGQQNQIKLPYKALEEGDEPPYPLHGMRKPIADIMKLTHTRKFWNVVGELRVYVLVGKDGKPKLATSFARLKPEFMNYANSVLMQQEFKSAICRGEPCGMIYPIDFKIGHAD